MSLLFEIHCRVKPLLSGLLLSGHLPQPGSWFALFYADVAEIVGSMVGVAYYSLCIYIVFWDTDKSELRAPPNPKVPG